MDKDSSKIRLTYKIKGNEHKMTLSGDQAQTMRGGIPYTVRYEGGPAKDKGRPKKAGGRPAVRGGAAGGGRERKTTPRPRQRPQRPERRERRTRRK